MATTGILMEEAPTQAGQGSVPGLLQRIGGGDHKAFAELARAHHGAVYRSVWRILGDASEAEDVTQEAFLKLWRMPGAVREEGSVRAWLCRVGINAAIDRKRKKLPQPVADLPEPAADTDGPEQALSRSEAGAAIDAALAGLPERQRTALVLTYYEGLSNAETATVLGVSAEAVESLLSRARRTLKGGLSERWRELLETLA